MVGVLNPRPIPPEKGASSVCRSFYLLALAVTGFEVIAVGVTFLAGFAIAETLDGGLVADLV